MKKLFKINWRCFWRHDWTKWEIFDGTSKGIFDKAPIPCDIQRRRCNKCGKYQQEVL